MNRPDIRRGLRGAILLAMLVASPMTVADQGEDREAGAPVELDRKPGEGEQCIVCGVAIECS